MRSLSPDHRLLYRVARNVRAAVLCACLLVMAMAGSAAAQEPATEPAPDQSAVRLFMPFVARSPVARTPWPANFATGVSPNAWLSWASEAPAAESAGYRWVVYLDLGETLPTTPVAGNLARTQLDTTTFTPGATYSWRVIGTHVDGARHDVIYGPIWHFTVDSGLRPQSDADLEAMVSVPAGWFQMGCDPANSGGYGCRERDVPLHAVYLDAYRLDKYEVTNRQYRACVDAGACSMPRRTDSLERNSYFFNPRYDFFPVLYVSWWDAVDYCTWADKRLPTEAEWEKAARGPIDTRPWPWGTERVDCSRANYTEDYAEPWTLCVGDTQWVGSFPLGASPYGVMDMSGNVFEWVHDKWDLYYYYYSPSLNPQGPDEPGIDHGPWFAIRGGSYRPRWWYQRTLNRHWGHHGDTAFDDAPFYRNNQVGFRCAESVP